METGISPEKIEAVKRYLANSAGDPIQLRFLLSIVLLGIGLFAVARPMASRLQESRAELEKQKAVQKAAEQLQQMYNQTKEYEVYTPSEVDQVVWGDYLAGRLEESGAKLISLEPKKKILKGNVFSIMISEVVAMGTYSQLVDFIDLLERGPRLVRIDALQLERVTDPDGVRLTCVVKGLLKNVKRIDGKWKGQDV